MNKTHVLLAASTLAALCASSVPAIAGNDPGDTCTAAQEGAFSLAAALSQSDGGYLLTCNGSQWIQAIKYNNNGTTNLQIDSAAAQRASNRQSHQPVLRQRVHE